MHTTRKFLEGVEPVLYHVHSHC